MNDESLEKDLSRGQLAGKVAVITGAGSGIGKETAEVFAREGARVAVVDLDGVNAERTAAGIRDAGGEAIAIKADVAVALDVAQMVSRTVDMWGRLDILHNNAGISMNPTPVEQVDEILFEQMFAVNVRSVFLGAKYAVPHMKRQGAGVILNTGSASGIRPRPGASAYSASKGAVIALSKSLAIELAPYQIRVVSINPFATDTPMLRDQIHTQNSDDGERKRLEEIPLGRLVTANDVARAALFLASDSASMVTGTAFEIDGGRLI